MIKDDFTDLRYGMFIHYGLYSLLGRGEWVMNRERLSLDFMRELAGRFTAERFDADAVCDLAVRGGMRYVVLTTMHHEGFRLYHTELSDFCCTKSPCGRDLTAEVIAAARKRGLRIGLYHSLNNWFDRPDAVAALEDPAAYDAFIARTFARLEELVRNVDGDMLWYDGWWPFDGKSWQAARMNAMLRSIRPGLLFNSRNGAQGDFATPEGHMNAPAPWRPWEGCMTLNDSWGYHAGDENWKSPRDVVKLLATAAQGRGNLLLNIGPRGDGSLPAASVRIVERVGQWLETKGEAIYPAARFSFGLEARGDHRGDWTHHGPLTAAGNNLYLLATNWPGAECVLAGLECTIEQALLLGTNRELKVGQRDGVVRVSGLPATPPDDVVPVIRLRCDRPPAMYNCGGMRIPRVAHTPYDPQPSDIQR